MCRGWQWRQVWAKRRRLTTMMLLFMWHDSSSEIHLSTYILDFNSFDSLFYCQFFLLRVINYLKTKSSQKIPIYSYCCWLEGQKRVLSCIYIFFFIWSHLPKHTGYKGLTHLGKNKAIIDCHFKHTKASFCLN